ncbi:omega transcriptional repressor [Pseudanabaena phage Pam4]|nr:omega transcriptional repressor [Pseudanabaena phage Pam4]
MTTDPPPDTPATPDDDPVVQVNVRIPRSLRDAIDARRAVKGLSRDRWMANAARFALQAAATGGVTNNTRGRTATPPHRRP